MVVKSEENLLQFRAILHSDPQLSFITENLAIELILDKNDEGVNLSGMGGKSTDNKAGPFRIVLKSESKYVTICLHTETADGLYTKQNNEVKYRREK